MSLICVIPAFCATNGNIAVLPFFGWVGCVAPKKSVGSTRISERLPRFVLSTENGVATVVVSTSISKVTKGVVGLGGVPSLEKKMVGQNQFSEQKEAESYL